jgi:hypothetical protein
LAAASDAVKVLNTVVIKAVLGRHDFGFKLPHTQDRHKPEFQRRRLHVLSMLRQMIVDRYLGDNDYVFWLDADFESIPQDAISRLVGLDLDMVIPLYTLGNGFMFDGSSYRTGPGGQIEGIKDLVERYPVQDLFEMDSINAAALVHRRVFAKVGYDPNDPDQEGPHLARAAIRAGMKAWFYKGVTIIHANV